MSPGHRPFRRGFTLVELIAVMAIMGLLAGLAGPLLVSAADGYADAATRRLAINRAAFALERIGKVIRESPDSPSGSGTAGIVSATATRVEFTNGEIIELSGTNLMLTLQGQAAARVCSDVSAFSLAYIGDDGETDTSGTPGDTRRINMSITVRGQELRTSAFIRTTRHRP